MIVNERGPAPSASLHKLSGRSAKPPTPKNPPLEIICTSSWPDAEPISSRLWPRDHHAHAARRADYICAYIYTLTASTSNPERHSPPGEAADLPVTEGSAPAGRGGALLGAPRAARASYHGSSLPARTRGPLPPRLWRGPHTAPETAASAPAAHASPDCLRRESSRCVYIRAPQRPRLTAAHPLRTPPRLSVTKRLESLALRLYARPEDLRALGHGG